jgi:hypothetical protein
MGAPAVVRQRRAGPLAISTVALVGWLAGTPLLLLLWGGWPLTGAPGWDAFRRLPLPTAVDQVIIGTLGVALWGIWGQFAGGVAVEVAALARGRAPRRRPDDPIRRFARHMVHSLALPPSPLARLLPPPPVDEVSEAASAPTAALPSSTPHPVPTAPETVGAPAVPAGRAADGGRGREAAASVAAVPVGAVRGLEEILGEVEVLVRVLGKVEAVRPAPSAGAAEQVLPARQKALEALVYLAFSDVGVSRRELERVLFPSGPGSERVLYNIVMAMLKVVGDQHPAATTGRHYVLSERVVTDYGIFCDLVAQAEGTDDPAVVATLLGEALSLVRGEPFSEISRGYTWAAAQRATMVAHVVDVAEWLAGRCLAQGDRAAAEAAARQGLLASPGDERLVGLLMSDAER